MYKRFVTALLFPLCMGGGLYAQQLAFPGAEGYGRFAKGARASESPEIYHVTNLNDSGEGSYVMQSVSPTVLLYLMFRELLILNPALCFLKI